MFEEYGLQGDLRTYRDDHVPELRVLEASEEFEAMPTDWLYELALVTETIDARSYPAEWIPANAPDALRRLSSDDLAVGMPGDGGVTWTAQTQPPLVIVKPRLTGAPADFRDFLVAEAILQCSLDLPETLLGFFEDHYRDVQRAADDDPDVTYRIAVSLYDGWKGLATRDHFREWADEYPGLHAAWIDAGERLAPRIDDLPGLLATGSLRFGEATELACSAIKHDLELPPPFAALDVSAYAERGAPFAVRWAEKTLEQLDRTLS